MKTVYGPASASGPGSSRTAPERHYAFSNPNERAPADGNRKGTGLPFSNPADKSWSFQSAGRADIGR